MKRMFIIGLLGVMACAVVEAMPVKSSIGAKGIADTGGEETLSAKSYVQDGLIAMWDGIENAGWGVHDDEATVWKDLISDAGDLDVLSGGSWTSSSLKCSGQDSAAQKVHAITVSSIRSIEVCYNRNRWNTTEIPVDFSHYRANDTTAALMLIPSATKSFTYQFRYYQSKPGMYVWSEQHKTKCTATVVRQDTSNTFVQYQSGNAVNHESGSGYVDGGNMGMIVGCDSKGNNKFKGEIYCIRVYSRPLTADEVAYNYSIDKIRFNLP